MIYVSERFLGAATPKTPKTPKTEGTTTMANPEKISTASIKFSNDEYKRKPMLLIWYTR